MWILRKSRQCNIYLIIALTFIFIFFCITFYQRSVPQTVEFHFNRSVTVVQNKTEEYLQVHIDLSSNSARCRDDDFLILYILSTATNFERRRVLRSTWASKRNGTCFVFIVGQPSGFLVNVGLMQKQLQDEKKLYEDLVEIDHIESYANVVYKEIAALLWSQRFYPDIPYLFKTDDDLIVDSILVSLIARVLASNGSTDYSFLTKHRPLLTTALLTANRTDFFRGGWAMDYQPTVRGGGKFGVSHEVWPHPVLPAYCSGFGWLMSKHIRNQLAQASFVYPKRKAAWIGDVFVSGFLAKAANVKCTGIHIDFDQTASANCSCLMVNNPMLTVCSSTFHAGGGGTETQKYIEYQRAWRVVQLRHNLTHTTIDNC